MYKTKIHIFSITSTTSPLGRYKRYRVSHNPCLINISHSSLQGVWKILPEPFICLGFHSFLCSVKMREKRILLTKNVLSVHFNVDTVTQLWLVYHMSKPELRNVLYLQIMQYFRNTLVFLYTK